MKFRRVFAAVLAFLIAFAAAPSSAGTWSAPQEHHLAHETAHQGEDRLAMATPHSDDSGSWTDSVSGHDCSPTAQGCCPGLAAVLPAPGCALASESGSARVAFAATLQLLSRVEGIYKPPWLDSPV